MSPKTTPSAPTTSAACAGARVPAGPRPSCSRDVGSVHRGRHRTLRAPLSGGGALRVVSQRRPPPACARSSWSCLRHLFQLLGGAELHELGAGLDDRRCGRAAGRTRRRPRTISSRSGEAVGEPALEHVAPVRAVAAVVGQALQQRGAVDIDPEGQEVDGVAVDVLVPVLDRAVAARRARRFPSTPSASRPPLAGLRSSLGIARCGGMRRSPHLPATVRRRPLLRQQAVLHREQARAGPAGGADLGVDVLDVVAGRLRRDHEPRARSACSTGRGRAAAAPRPRAA